MSLLYINENNAVIGIESNQCTIKYSNDMKKMIPIETLESITIMGRAQITTQCIQECLKRGIPISYFSKRGSYFGRLFSTEHVNAPRQRKQCSLEECIRVYKIIGKRQDTTFGKRERNEQEDTIVI